MTAIDIRGHDPRIDGVPAGFGPPEVKVGPPSIVDASLLSPVIHRTPFH